MITGKTRLLGMIGHPLEHSLSPKTHNAGFAASGLDYAYVGARGVPEKLPEAFSGGSEDTDRPGAKRGGNE